MINFCKIVTFIFLVCSSQSRADVCAVWLAKSKIKKGESCLNRCVIHKVDLRTFGCHSICNKLCDIDLTPDFIFTLSSLYPGLTDSERALSSENPKDAYIAYTQKAKAESGCENLYGSNNINDESDACRHFLWAAFLTRELGPDVAQRFLNAHEQEPTQPDKEKIMDLANNRAGIDFAKNLKNSKEFSVDNVLKGFSEAVKKNELIILKPKIKN